MALMPILTAPNRRLKQKSEPVSVVDSSIQILMDNMAETMYAAPGIGLAAPQVGVLKRVIVVDVGNYDANHENQPDLLCLANPEILEKDGDITWTEGCLSVPDFSGNVHRAERIRLRALDRNGKPLEIQAQGLLSICLQHEIDHLDGVLFIDHLSALKRSLILQKLKKRKKAEKEP